MGFKWPNGVGYIPCICDCGHELEQDEVEVTGWSGGSGDHTKTAKVKCKICGATGNDGNWDKVHDMGW